MSDIGGWSLSDRETTWVKKENKIRSASALTLASAFRDVVVEDGVTRPSLSETEDGTADLYWKSNENTALITFHDGGRVAYSTKIDGIREKGTFRAGSFIPDDLMTALHEF